LTHFFRNDDADSGMVGGSGDYPCGTEPNITEQRGVWMRTVSVIGGGLAGVSVSYELVSRGYQTVLYESRDGIALETSYANGAMLTPSMADPWNAPGVHRHLAASLFDPRSAMKLRLKALPSLIGWGRQFLRHSTRARHEAATRACFLLGQHSMQRTRELRRSLSLEYDAASVGTLKVFTSTAGMQGPLALAGKLKTLGLEFEVLDGSKTVAAEPALAEIRGSIAGSIRFPDDETGDARQFCQQLSAAFVKAGGVLRTGARVDGVAIEKGAAVGVHVGGRLEHAHEVVIAAGNTSVALARKLGIALPIRPAKGYTVTFDASHLEGAPVIPIVDDARHTAIVPLGRRLRVVGTAEFAGNDLTIRPERIENLLAVLSELMPGIARQLPCSSALPWAGLRPMSADGLPFIGPAAIPGLHINAGHGHLGWTLASGSAHLLADLLEGRPPAIDPTPYRTIR
jgi:D-amino-acid dehydrogenase